MAPLDEPDESITVSRDDARAARAAADRLRAALGDGSEIHVSAQESAEDAIPLPRALASRMLDMLEAMAEGRPFSVTLHPATLTPQEAAEHLNLSCRYIMQKMDDGTLPFERTGAQRTIRHADVVDFGRRLRERSDTALKEMARIAQENDLE